jgi:hypothetical protein
MQNKIRHTVTTFIKWTTFDALILAALVCAGCVHLPKFSVADTKAVGGGPTVALATAPAHSSASTVAIQWFFNVTAGLSIVAGLSCLALAGLAGYGGHVLPAIKLGIGGFIFPIGGIWFAFHWMLAVAVVLLATAAVEILIHRAFLKPIVAGLGKLAVKAESFGGAVTQKF